MKKKVSKKKDQYTVVLEDLRSQFKVFGESLSGVRDDVNGLKKDVGGLKQDVGSLKDDVSILKHDVAEIRQDLKEFKEETKSNFGTVFKQLSNNDDEIKGIKTRVTRLEKKEGILN